MKKWSVQQMIQAFEAQETFEAVAEDYSFTLKIQEYTPYVCGAVHDGHQFRRELWENCIHTEYERWFEEDPCTKAFVDAMPIVISGNDSRFEYDLNRDPENAIFDTAWGKKLWKQPLTENEKAISLNKHSAFYLVVHALIATLEKIHEKVVVYDIHSYNWRRWDREVPVINLGTSNIDNDRFGTSVEAWRASLAELDLPGVSETTSLVNDTFFGNGYFLKYITENFKNTLVLATEFKKIYCDELRQVIFPEVVAAIAKQLPDKIRAHAANFQETVN
ncbi:MAG: hypothetical protein CMC35_02610 [Flavobacteriaceae bacterium]|nr:hypothetical protein [Flavobacteriaceae bacterium]|tara:strand:+ start:1786 stop:2613 length:828 start_codon:yes stop_codon:yes gene_type:complete